jgi:di/tricarboxylate transporter
LICWLAVLVSLVLFLAPVPDGIAPGVMRAAGAVALVVGLWSTGALPEYLTAILFFFIVVVLGIAPPEVVFSGFHSSAVWLVFGGLVIGLGVQRSGLGARLVRMMLAHAPKSYFGLLFAVVLIGVALAFIVPSAVGRVLLLMPLVLAAAEQLGFDGQRNGRTGMVLAAGFGTMTPAFAILPANVPNMGLIGSAESLYGVSFSYGAYFLLNFTIMGVAAMVAVPLLLSLLFRDTPRRAELSAERLPWSAEEQRLLAIVLAALALWLTDFAHGISPAWVALGAAILCLMPRIGVLPANALAKDINFGPWIFVAGVIGLGSVANHSGLGEVVGQALFSVIELAPGEGIRNFAAIVGVGAVVGAVTTLPAAPAIMTPLGQSLADAAGWPLVDVLLLQVPTWMVFPFAYQAPPLVAAISLGGLRIAQAMRFLIAYLVLAILVILPLHYFWGRLLGYFP